MKTTPEHNERMSKMTFASVYPHYINKVESKGKSIEELHQVIECDKKITDCNKVSIP